MSLANNPIAASRARFALNMAVCADKVPVGKLLSANVPAFLVGMLSSENDAVRSGSAADKGSGECRRRRRIRIVHT